MKHPKWKQRLLKQKADADAAERAARYKRFWEAVEKPRKSIDYDVSPPPV